MNPFENDEFEEFLGIETTNMIYNNRYHDDYFRYEPTSYSGLVLAFDWLELSSHDRVVDFGCGKGRVLFYLNQRFSCEVCGIEVDKNVYELALNNLAYYNTRFRSNQNKIELILGKAEEYEIRQKDTVFYFFNPFESYIFKNIIDKIIESVKKHNRAISIVMYYPEEKYRQYLKNKCFTLLQLVKLPSYEMDCNEKMCIYTYAV